MSPELERLVGKAVLDTDFRNRLLDTPAGQLKDFLQNEGFKLSDDEVKQVAKAATNRGGKNKANTNQALDAAKSSSWN